MKFFNCLMVISISCGTATYAKDLGVHGEVYQITEKNALDAIYEKLEGMEKSGVLEQKKQEAIKTSMHSAKNPKRVPGLITATKKHVFTYDPTIVLAEHLTTDEGQIIAPAGTRVNPLDTIGMSKTLVFFDGADQAQVQAVEGLLKVYDRKITPILTGGTWLELTKKHKRQFYFDQYGYMVNRFGISAVPAVVRQKGKVLEITEIPAEELKP